MKRIARLLFGAALVVLAACSESPQLPALDRDAVILAFGDSLTRGTGAGAGEDYPSVLAGLTGLRVVNAGVPGEISRDGLRRLPALLEKHEPALLILCHGGNDLLQRLSPKETAANLEKMVRMAAERGIAVVLVGVPEPGLLLSDADYYAEVAEATGAVYVKDIIARVLGDASLKSDPVHPNADGYRQVAEALHAALRKAGALP